VNVANRISPVASRLGGYGGGLCHQKQPIPEERLGINWDVRMEVLSERYQQLQCRRILTCALVAVRVGSTRVIRCRAAQRRKRDSLPNGEKNLRINSDQFVEAAWQSKARDGPNGQLLSS
jgi:hypothetical protein